MDEFAVSPLRASFAAFEFVRTLAVSRSTLAARLGIPEPEPEPVLMTVPFLPLSLALDGTYQTLLAAVYAEPDNDLPRLMLADFMEGDGQNVTCDACGGRGKMHDNERISPINPPLWAMAGRRDEANRITYCRACTGSGVQPDARTQRAHLIRSQCADHTQTVWGMRDNGVRVTYHRGFPTEVSGPLFPLRQTLWRLRATDWPMGEKGACELRVTDKVPEVFVTFGGSYAHRWLFGPGHDRGREQYLIPYYIRGSFPDDSGANAVLHHHILREADRIAARALDVTRRGFDSANVTPVIIGEHEEWVDPDAPPQTVRFAPRHAFA